MPEPARRDLAKAAGGTAAAIGVVLLRGPAPALFSGPGGGHGADHGPASPIGPLHWGALGFPACGLGMGQSLAGMRTGQVATLTVLRCPVGTSNREFSAS